MAQQVGNNPWFIDPACGKELVGTTEAHCAKCHQTFCSAYAFDQHIIAQLDLDELPEGRLQCGDPAKLEMVLLERKSESGGEPRAVWASGHSSQKVIERIWASKILTAV
jgi:hypothetical protein